MSGYSNTSYNILQVLCQSHILLITDLCISYLLDQRKFILKPVLGCDRKPAVVRIPNQTYGFDSSSGL